MRAAITTCDNRVCPRLDCAPLLVVIEVHDGQEAAREALDISGWPAKGRAARLAELAIDDLICGGVSKFDEAGFDASSIRLISDVTGPVDAVVRAVLAGTIRTGADCWKQEPVPRSRRLAQHRGTTRVTGKHAPRRRRRKN